MIIQRKVGKKSFISDDLNLQVPCWLKFGMRIIPQQELVYFIWLKIFTDI